MTELRTSKVTQPLPSVVGATSAIDILVPAYGNRPYVEGDSLDVAQPLVFTVANVLSVAECQQMIARMEELGPTDAPVTTARGFVMRPDIRNNKRVVFDDVPLAAELFRRVAGSIPARLCNMTAVGANERFRAYRYEPGHRFAPHYDGAFARSPSERSHLTYIVYLNDEFEGGATRFHDFDLDVKPRPGLALFFQHQLLHEGCVVTSGTKYALRTDVMYRR